MSGLGARLAFYPTLVYNIVLEKFTSRNWYDRIDPTIIVGALPFPTVSRNLVENENVRGVVSLNEGYELRRWVTTSKQWEELGVCTLYLPTIDLVAAPSQADLRRGVSFILDHAKNEQSVYVHCKAGRTRSATLAACYLVKRNRWNPDKAIEALKMRRPHIWLRREQLRAIDTFHKENVKSLNVDSEI